MCCGLEWFVNCGMCCLEYTIFRIVSTFLVWKFSVEHDAGLFWLPIVCSFFVQSRNQSISAHVVYLSGLAVVLAVVRCLGRRLDPWTGHGVVVLKSRILHTVFEESDEQGLFAPNGRTSLTSSCIEKPNKDCWVIIGHTNTDDNFLWASSNMVEQDAGIYASREAAHQFIFLSCRYPTRGLSPPPPRKYVASRRVCSCLKI